MMYFWNQLVTTICGSMKTAVAAVDAEDKIILDIETGLDLMKGNLQADICKKVEKNL